MIYGHVKAIVEEKDATEEQRKIAEINSGLYCFDIQELISALEKITPNNASRRILFNRCNKNHE